MASIDERIVEMTFRRDDFNRGVEETLNGLNKLDQTLSGSGGIGQNVEKIAGKFNILGALGFTAVQRVGGAAIDAGAKIFSNFTKPLFEGGKRRAINIEQARFAFQGLGIDTEEAMDNALYAVKGTAYGLDEAAKAASQLSASNVNLGDDMKGALRGISGVAAMTSSSYDDIASVFVKVAGQGRLMGDDLNRLGARGINAAATLAESFGVTEEELRKMVSQGKIGFQDFANAMDEAFGEQATKANDTYTGALANMNAALARIGAEFAAVKMEKHRRMFNALSPVIDKVKDSLDPLVRVYQAFSNVMAEKFEAGALLLLEKFDWGSLTKIIDNVSTGVFNLYTAFGSLVSPIVNAFKAVFMVKEGGDGLLSTIADLTTRFKLWTRGLILNRDQAAKVQAVFEKLFGAIKMGFVPIEKLKEFMSEAGEKISEFGDTVSEIFPSMGDAFKDFGDRVSEYGNGFSGVIQATLDVLGEWYGGIKDFFKSVLDPTGSMDTFTGSIGSVKEALASLVDWVSKTAVSAFEGLKSAWDSLSDAFKGIQNPITSTTGLFQRFVSGITPILESIGGAFKTAFQEIGDALRNADPLTIFLALQNILSTIMGMKIADGFQNLAKGIGDGLSAAGAGIGGFLDRINTSVEKSRPEMMLLIAGAIGILAGSLWLMAQIPQDSLVSSGIAIAAMMGLLVGALAGITKVMGSATVVKLPSTAAALMLFAVGVNFMALALQKLAGVPAGQLGAAVLAIAALSGVLVVISQSLSKIEPGKMMGASIGILILVGALYALAGVVAILGALPYAVLEQGMIATGIALGALVLAAMILNEYAEDILKTSVGMVAMALALQMLVVPITALGLLPYEVLEQGMIATATALGALVLAAIILNEFAPKLILSSIGLIAMALALQMMVVPITALGLLPYDVMVQGLTGLLIALGALMIAAVVMEGAVVGAAGVLAIAAALLILAVAIRTVANIPTEQAAMGLIVLAGGLLIMNGAAALATTVLPGVLGLAGLMLAFGVAAIAMGAAVVLGAVGVRIFASALPALGAGLASFAQHAMGVAIAIPLLAALGLAMIPVAAASLLLGAGMIMLAGAIAILSAGLGLLAITGPTGAVALMGFVKAIEPLIWKIPKLALLSATLLALGGAMVVLGAGLILVGAGSVAAALGLGLLAGAGVLAGIAGERLKSAFSGFEPIIANITAFGSALSSLAGSLTTAAAGFARLAGSLAGLSGSLAVVAAGIALLAAVAGSTASTVIASFTGMAAGMAVSASVVQSTAVAIAASIVGLAAMVSGAVPAVSGAIRLMISQMVSTLNSGRGQITSATNQIITAFALMATRLVSTGTPAALAVRKMITTIVRELRKGSGQISPSITNIINGMRRLSTGINQNGSRASSAARSMMSRVASAISSGGGAASSRAYSVGVAVANGMARGIRAGGGRVAAAARSIAISSMNSAKSALGVASPSKEFYQIAEYVIDGFVGGLNNNVKQVERASENLGTASIDATREAFDEIVSQFDNDFDFNPVITPVLDLDSMKTQASGIGGLLGVQEVDARFNRNQANNLALLEEAIRNTGAGSEEKPVQKIEYIQNNYSPKALSSAEIYRQTRNQISTVSRRD